MRGHGERQQLESEEERNREEESSWNQERNVGKVKKKEGLTFATLALTLALCIILKVTQACSHIFPVFYCSRCRSR